MGTNTLTLIERAESNSHPYNASTLWPILFGEPTRTMGARQAMLRSIFLLPSPCRSYSGLAIPSMTEGKAGHCAHVCMLFGINTFRELLLGCGRLQLH